ncbi:hypothetical protein BDD12DRAFT_805690 [Trichophaea hybrida]|nr:hypothetical protein BDD12DRAFT_805690 [Trichophaea hybrida]
MATLETLPLDLHYHLLSYLDLPRPELRSAHPYLALSNVSKGLYSIVESYCTHRLTRLRTCFPTTAPKLAARPKNSRRKYLQHTASRCRFCNRTTTAYSKLYTFIPCCAACDKREWPEKITLTKAKQKYGLKEEQLTSACHYGAYYCHNVYTRMFNEPEVRKLAERVHGDLDAYFRVKEERRAKRKPRKPRERRPMMYAVYTAIPFDELLADDSEDDRDVYDEIFDAYDAMVALRQDGATP